MIKTSSIKIKTKGNTDLINITEKVQSILKNSEIKEGIVIIFVAGSTAALTTIEYEPGLIHDLKEFFEKISPRHKEYNHNKIRGDSNGHAHVCASLLKPSLTIPFKNSQLLLGTWQQVTLIDFDDRHREREVIIQVNGE